MRIAVDPIHELARQRGILDRIAHLRNDLDVTRCRLPDAALGVDRCNDDVTAAEQHLHRLRQLAADATHRHAEMQTAITYLEGEIARLEALEAEAAKHDARHVAEADLARARQQVEALSSQLEQVSDA